MSTTQLYRAKYATAGSGNSSPTRVNVDELSMFGDGAETPLVAGAYLEIVGASLYGAVTPGQVVFVSDDSVGLASAASDGNPNLVGVLIDINRKFILGGPATLTRAQWDAVVTGQSGGLTPRTVYYLSSTEPGKMVTDPPSAGGTYIMRVGVAKDAMTLYVQPGIPILNPSE